jgi:predicted ATP-dependent endonuclease of OLD family
MIKDIKISKFRGILEGAVSGFTPLNVLVGPSGSGKSTVIDAIYLAASPEPTGPTQKYSNKTPLQQIIDRRGPTGPALSHAWLVWKLGRAGAATIVMRNESLWTRTMELKAGDPSEVLRVSAKTTRQVEAVVTSQHTEQSFFNDLGGVRIVSTLDNSPNDPLHDLFSEITKAGQQDELLSLVREIDPALQDMQILTQYQQPFLTLKYGDYVVPVELAGDGVVSLVRFCMKLTAYPAQTLLIEEPELHLHYRAIQMAARSLWGAVKQKKQIILTTHSLDLIDSLIAEASDDVLKQLTVFQMRCDGGKLRVNPVAGTDVKFQRKELEAELR